VVAFSGGEKVARCGHKPLVGHLAAWNYFQSIKSPANTGVHQKVVGLRQGQLPGARGTLTNDPMEATYIGINMWKQAVEKAKSTDTDKVIAHGRPDLQRTVGHRQQDGREKTITCTSRCSSARSRPTASSTWSGRLWPGQG
jgi:ABC-type branched-subunit amino acid transport system substrate-binding protein